MFAFAVWDRQDRVLTLGRDRLGRSRLLDGKAPARRARFSDPNWKALHAHPAFERKIDRDAASLFMRHNNVPGALCDLPGGLASCSGASGWRCSPPTVKASRAPIGRVWRRLAGRPRAICRKSGRSRRGVGSRASHRHSRSMMADAPLGAFLSGGISNTY